MPFITIVGVHLVDIQMPPQELSHLTAICLFVLSPMVKRQVLGLLIGVIVPLEGWVLVKPQKRTKSIAPGNGE